jgi:hypothetical protein
MDLQEDLIQIPCTLPACTVCLPSGLPLSSFLTQTLYAVPISHIYATWPLHPIILNLIYLRIFCNQQNLWSVSIYNFLQPRYFLPLRKNSSPENPVPKHPQSIIYVLPLKSETIFHKNTNRWNKSFVYICILCFLLAHGKTKHSVYVGSEVCTAVIMKSIIFWDMTPCSALSCTRRFGGTYRLNLQGRRIVRQTSKHAGSSEMSGTTQCTTWPYPRRWYSSKHSLNTCSQNSLNLNWCKLVTKFN